MPYIIGKSQYQIYDTMCPPTSPSALDDEFNVDGSGTPAGWTAVGTAATLSVSKGVLLFESPALSGFNSQSIEKVLPTGAFTVATRVSITGDRRFCSSNLILRNSTTGRSIRFGLYVNEGSDGAIAITDYRIARTKWSALDTRDSIDQSPFGSNESAWLRMSFDGTDLSAQYSRDGFSFRTLFTEAMSSHFTGGNLPDRVGLAALSENSSVSGRRQFDFFRYFPVADADIGRIITVGS